MTHLWTKYRGVCALTILIVVQFAYAASRAQSHVDSDTKYGRWVKSDGSEVTMVCPAAYLFEERDLKMPQGCVSEKPGVWLTVKKHAELRAELARTSRELELTKLTLEEYRTHVKRERAELVSYFQSTSSELQSIAKQVEKPSFSWTSAATGFSAGALMCSGIVIGGAF